MAMMTENFAVFILTHGRPNRVKTYDTLKKQGYTGRIYIIIDNEDATADEYRARFGEQVIMFDKLAISKTFDTGDNFEDRRTVVYARNACFGIAKELGLDYFLELDDDYHAICWKFSPSLKFQDLRVKKLDTLFDAVLAYYQDSPMITVALGQGGDLIGGGQTSSLAKVQSKRKAMNSFFCSTLRPFQFAGRVNEDVNTYCILGNRGALLISIFNACIHQSTTQSAAGGMTEMYENEGTYIKSFYTVMYCPSFVKIGMMGETHRRLHHRIKWADAVPCILDERWRKARRDTNV